MDSQYTPESNTRRYDPKIDKSKRHAKDKLGPVVLHPLYEEMDRILGDSGVTSFLRSPHNYTNDDRSGEFRQWLQRSLQDGVIPRGYPAARSAVSMLLVLGVDLVTLKRDFWVPFEPKTSKRAAPEDHAMPSGSLEFGISNVFCPKDAQGLRMITGLAFGESEVVYWALGDENFVKIKDHHEKDTGWLLKLTLDTIKMLDRRVIHLNSVHEITEVTVSSGKKPSHWRDISETAIRSQDRHLQGPNDVELILDRDIRGPWKGRIANLPLLRQPGLSMRDNRASNQKRSHRTFQGLGFRPSAKRLQRMKPHSFAWKDQQISLPKKGSTKNKSVSEQRSIDQVMLASSENQESRMTPGSPEADDVNTSIDVQSDTSPWQAAPRNHDDSKLLCSASPLTSAPINAYDCQEKPIAHTKKVYLDGEAGTLNNVEGMALAQDRSGDQKNSYAPNDSHDAEPDTRSIAKHRAAGLQGAKLSPQNTIHIDDSKVPQSVGMDQDEDAMQLVGSGPNVFYTLSKYNLSCEAWVDNELPGMHEFDVYQELPRAERRTRELLYLLKARKRLRDGFRKRRSAGGTDEDLREAFFQVFDHSIPNVNDLPPSIKVLDQQTFYPESVLGDCEVVMFLFKSHKRLISGWRQYCKTLDSAILDKCEAEEFRKKQSHAKDCPELINKFDEQNLDIKQVADRYTSV